MKRSALPAALVLVAGLTLAACSAGSGDGGDAGASDVATISAAPATGEAVTGDGYEYSLPDGWTTTDDPSLVGQADTLAYDATDTDDFSDNINVLLSPAGEVTPDQVETQGLQEFTNGGSTDVAVDERLMIAGSEAAHLSGPLSAGGASYFLEQYYPSHDGQTYVVTFSFSDTLSDADRDAVTDAVLASWTWS
jgi:predicted small secreted protein